MTNVSKFKKIVRNMDRCIFTKILGINKGDFFIKNSKQMNRRLIIVAIIASFSWACTSNSESETETKSSDKEKEQWIVLEVKEGGYSLQVFVPIPEISKGETKIEYMEDLGELKVVAGEEFDYFIYEDESQINMVLNEINNHPFYQVEIIEQTDSTLLYRFFLEDGSNEVWHFYSERSLGQPLLMMRSNQNKDFNEYYSRKMLESSLKLTALK